MSEPLHKVTIQTRAPRGTDPGRVAEGFYVVVDNAVVMTDQDGKPLDDSKYHLGPKDDPRLIACVLTRRRSRTAGPVNGFDAPIRYPKLRY